MKKFISIICGVFCLVFFTACGTVFKPAEVRTVVDCTCKVQFDGKDYECAVTRTSENIGVVKITKPEALDGMTFSWRNGEYELSMKDLSGNFNKEVLPKESFALCIMQVLSNASIAENVKFMAKKGEESIFEGMSDAGKYKIHTDSKGEIRKIIVEEKRLEVNFA